MEITYMHGTLDVDYTHKAGYRDYSHDEPDELEIDAIYYNGTVLEFILDCCVGIKLTQPVCDMLYDGIPENAGILNVTEFAKKYLNEQGIREDIYAYIYK